MTSNRQILLLSATKEELAHIPDTLKEHPSVHYAAVGIGSVRAAIGTTKVLQSLKGKPEVIFIGSVGSVDHYVPLGTHVIATAVIATDLSEGTEKGFHPKPTENRIKAEESLVDWLRSDLDPEALSQAVYTTPSISSNTEVGVTLMNQTQAAFENLELFGIAAASEVAGVKWSSFSPVTNYVGPEGHEQWKANFRVFAKDTANKICSYFKQLA